MNDETAAAASGKSGLISALGQWIGLIGANLVPIIGVLFWGWDVGLLLLYYWLENAIIGIFNIPRILGACAKPKEDGAEGTVQSVNLGEATPVIAAVFFFCHYGGFLFAHAVAVITLWMVSLSVIDGVEEGPELFVEMASAVFTLELLIGLPLLVLFHAAQFRRDESYRHRHAFEQMKRPYARLIVLHLTLVLGAFLTILMGHPLAMLLLFVVLKMIADIHKARSANDKPPNT